ncbi:MAG: T9SS type A sorting domain-containing protein [Melioribacteraceae bacterium]
MNRIKIELTILFFILIPTFLYSQSFENLTEGVLWEYLEWEITDVASDGNPYDVTASVSFIHQNTSEVITTQMFYDENHVWKFRFTATQLGVWHFFSSSKIEKLDKLSGEVNIIKNPNSKAVGFLTNFGNKFALQTTPDSVKGFLLNVYMNQTNVNYSFRNGDRNSFANYALEAKNSGCTAVFSTVVGNSWFNFPTSSTSSGVKENPDPRTFRKLEEMISEARKIGQQVHIWAWGDEERGQTPIGIDGGINGISDKRLQKYIAARLGPLPGWSMGYGFDLHEWVDSSEVKEWAEFMQDNLSWQHLLSARGQILETSNSINSYDGAARNVPLSTSLYGPSSLEEIFADLNNDLTHPHLYEERHSYNRQSSDEQNGWNLEMDGTRRLMWLEAMAGGMGGWFGFYPENAFAFGGYPYPNPEQLATFRKFWIEENRFLLDMNTTKISSNFYSLESEQSNSVVLFKGDTDVIGFDFSSFENNSIIAVDTKLEYSEIIVNNSSIVNSEWNAPYNSDWVLAIGDFSNYNFSLIKDVPKEKDVKLNSLSVSLKDSTIDLSWETTIEKNLNGFAIEASFENDTTNWESRGFILSNVNGNSTNTYKFSDVYSIEKGDVNLRLKMFFKDNSISYSKNITVEREEIKKYLVEFSSLSFNRNENSITINWGTLKESEVSQYILERSSNTISTWSEIRTLISTGSANSSSTYTIVDTDVFADTTYKYRLKILFTNNSIEYSEVITVENSVIESKNISIHSLTAQKNDEGINLNWHISNEINFHNFNVEFTHDTNDVWQTIGIVYQVDNKNNDSSYFFVDKNKSTENKLHYRLKILFTDGTFHYSSTLIYNNFPNDFSLHQNYPNPFNNSTTIDFSLVEEAQVSLDIYNVLGEKIKSLFSLPLSAGYHSYELDATNLSSGVYYYRLTSNNNSAIKKMLYLK